MYHETLGVFTVGRSADLKQGMLCSSVSRAIYRSEIYNCVNRFGSMVGCRHGTQLQYMWPGTTPLSMSLLISHNRHILYERQSMDTNHTAGMASYPCYLGILKTPTLTLSSINWAREAGWLANWLLHADCDWSVKFTFFCIFLFFLLTCFEMFMFVWAWLEAVRPSIWLGSTGQMSLLDLHAAHFT